MPPKKNTNANDTPRLTDGEERFIKALLESMTALPEADWEQCANTLGLKDGKCAKERWRQISSQRGWSRHKKRAPFDSTTNSTSSSSVAVSAGGASSFGAPAARPVTDGHLPGVQTRASRAIAAASSGSGSSRSAMRNTDSASVALLHHIASAALPAVDSTNHDTTVKKETRVKRESLKSESSGSSTYITCKEEYDSDVKADSDRTNSHRVKKEEPMSDDDCVETDSHGVKVKKERAESDDDVIEVKDEHEDNKFFKPKKDEPDSDDDHKGGYVAPYIPFGDPAHCMSF